MKHNKFRLEPLESRHLLAADGATLVNDSFELRQNEGESSLSVLVNDRFDDDYAGEKRITSVSLASQGSRVEIGETGQTLRYTPAAGISGQERVTYFVDGRFDATAVINITAALHEDSYEFVPDRDSYQLDVLANDPFWAGYSGPREITLVSASSNGATVEIADDRNSLTYHRADHRYGSDTLVYVVDDIYPATVKIDVLSPLTRDRHQLVQFDPTQSVNVVRNDQFWDGYQGDRKVTHILDVPDGAEARVEDGERITFSPNEIDHGTYNLRYVVDNRFEESVSFRVERPVRDDFATVDANSRAFEIELLENDTYRDLENRVIQHDVIDRITMVSETEQGGSAAITLDGQGVLYTPPTGYIGEDSFVYTADEQHEATVRINVRDPLSDNDQRNDHFSLIRGTVDNRLDVLANDFFGDGYVGNRVITSVSDVEGATVAIEADGKSLRFTSHDDAPNYSFTYEVDHSLTGTVRISNRSVATSESYTYDQPTETTLRVVDQLDIPSNYVGAGVITSVTQPDNGGAAAITSGGRSIRIATGVGAGEFQYTIDGKYTATIHTRYNPRLQSDYFVVHQNSGESILDPLHNDFNNSSERRWGRYRGPKLITQVDSTTENGTVSVSADGAKLVFKPNADFVGTESITYVVDNYLEATVEVAVARLLRHDRFRVAPDSADNHLNVLGNDLVGGEYDGGLVITGLAAVGNGAQVNVSSDGKSVIYTPAVGFTGSDTFEYTVDGQLKANITVEVHSDATSLYPQVASLDAFKQLVLDATASNLNPWPPFDLDLSETSDGAGRDHSETNVQVAGVDEADLVETDGDYLYTLTHGQLVVTTAWPADELNVVGRTEIKGTPIGQYLHYDRLTVISQAEDPIVFDRSADAIFPYPRADPTTLVTVLDVSDRAAPKLIQRTEIEGNHVQTRRIDDYVYLVVNDRQSLVPPLLTICDEKGETCRTETAEEREVRIESSFGAVVEDLLPHYESYGADGKLVRSGLLIQPEDIFDPISEGASSLISVAAIDVTNNTPGLASATGVLTTGASELYVTAEHLYVFESHYDWLGTQQHADNPSTKIMKFELDSEFGTMDFTATGQVPGRMLDQFSADEFDGHLRIATTISNARSGNFTGRDENALFVLRDDAGILEHVGTLQNLALNESIRSVRYFGDRALITTFQTVDPLFSVDLSDHGSPKVKGFVTLPGYATYTQFVGDDLVLTIGRNTGSGWGGVLVISLFNVQDSDNPILLDQFNWAGFSRSVAETDHHAFSWFASHETLAIPAMTTATERSDRDNDGYAEHVVRVTDYELNVFSIDVTGDDGIQIQGSVEMDSPLMRSAFIEDKLYAIATDSIKSTEITSPNVVVDEVSIRPPDGEDGTTEPELGPIESRALAAQARQDLAGAKGLREEDVMLVATEPDDELTRIMLRAGDEHFVYEAMAGTLQSDLAPRTYRFAGTQLDWYNDSLPLDTNGDGFVTARDALLIINMVNSGLEGLLPTATVRGQLAPASDDYQVDTNGDGFVTALDALRVINYLNARAVPEPSTPAAADAFFASELMDDDRDTQMIQPR